MNTTTELQYFRDFLNEKLANGGAELTPEEALDEWRELHPDPDELEDEEDDLTAIKAALDDLDRGEKAMPFEEFDREMRRKYNIPPEPRP